MELREIRNELTHEYEDEPKENADKIVKIYLLKDKLASYYLIVERYIKNKKQV